MSFCGENKIVSAFSLQSYDYEYDPHLIKIVWRYVNGQCFTGRQGWRIFNQRGNKRLGFYVEVLQHYFIIGHTHRPFFPIKMPIVSLLQLICGCIHCTQTNLFCVLKDHFSGWLREFSPHEPQTLNIDRLKQRKLDACSTCNFK